LKLVGFLVLVVASVAAACSGGTANGPPTGIIIQFPERGATVSAARIAVGGIAPAGARIVHDIPFGFDEEAIAAFDGSWQIVVALDEGANDIVFRIGDDSSTEVHFSLTYLPGGQPGSTVLPGATSGTDSPTKTGAPNVRTFGDGTFDVGVDIKPGTYRLREPASCYWARLKGFDGTLDDIIANELVDDAYSVVTIKSTDAGFEADGCGEWSSDLSKVTDSKSSITVDGTYIVGTDISPGKWKSSGGGDSCYWARLSAFTGTLGAIIANHLGGGGATIVTIRSTDKGFSTEGCGTWNRQ
jgi:hypothetical protein